VIFPKISPRGGLVVSRRHVLKNFLQEGSAPSGSIAGRLSTFVLKKFLAGLKIEVELFEKFFEIFFNKLENKLDHV
jgi:hypothetical protein